MYTPPAIKNVGVGTQTPQALFQIQGGRAGSTDSSFIVDTNGNVRIGTLVDSANFKLSVKGEIRAMAITVTDSNWADYVFDPSYPLASLDEVEHYISENKHLPGVPSARQIATRGLDVGKTEKILMTKIEELTLYMLELKKQNELMAGKISELQKKIK